MSKYLARAIFVCSLATFIFASEPSVAEQCEAENAAKAAVTKVVRKELGTLGPSYLTVYRLGDIEESFESFAAPQTVRIYKVTSGMEDARTRSQSRKGSIGPSYWLVAYLPSTRHAFGLGGFSDESDWRTLVREARVSIQSPSAAAGMARVYLQFVLGFGRQPVTSALQLRHLIESYYYEAPAYLRLPGDPGALSQEWLAGLDRMELAVAWGEQVSLAKNGFIVTSAIVTTAPWESPKLVKYQLTVSPTGDVSVATVDLYRGPKGAATSDSSN